MNTAQLGKDGVLYFGAADAALSELTRLTCVKNVKLDSEFSDIDTTTRANAGFKSHHNGLCDLKLTFDLVKTPTDSAYTAIVAAYVAGTPQEFCPLSGSRAAVNSTGYRANFNIAKLGEDQPLDGVIVNAVECTLRDFLEFVTIAGSGSGS